MDALTRKPYGANFVLDFPIEDQLDVALTRGVRLISFFWGDGRRYLTRVKAAGAIAVQVVGSIAEAREAADALPRSSACTTAIRPRCSSRW